MRAMWCAVCGLTVLAYKDGLKYRCPRCDRVVVYSD
jgi:predicted RNA-binding Zn-ribbon protein involved in translation (DUF1610 family)